MTPRRRYLYLAAALAVIAGGCARAPDAEVTVHKNIPYYAGPDADAGKHVLDLYLPAGEKDFPLVVFIHGGSWRFGDKDGPTNPYYILGRRFARRGIGVAVASYRLAPGVRHPAQARDVARAFAWTYKHAEGYGADPRRVFLCGHSSGAHLAALAALDRRYLAAEGLPADAVAGVIGVSGPYNISYSWAEAPWFTRRFQLAPAFGEDAAGHAAASANNYITPDAPPFLLLYAQYEQRHFARQADRLAAALNAAGVPAAVYELRGKTHLTEIFTLGKGDEEATALVLSFIAAH